MSITPSGIRKDELRIVFMGTPQFAVASLKILAENGFNIVGVVTAPDKPAGRGMQLQQSAVKKYAVEKDLNILQPVKLKDPEFLEQLKALHADLQVVVAFRMLPEAVWNMPPLGTINLHASLLPQYRGAAPINWAIINGEKETGVTTFKLQHEIDTGNILLSERIPIGESETAGELHDRMKETGAALLLKTVTGIREGSLEEHPQLRSDGDRQTGLRHAPKIFSETCRIDWNRTTAEVYNLIRGLSPYPGACTNLDGKMFKIYQARPAGISDPKAGFGTYETDHKTYLRFACRDGYLDVTELQLAGKKKMHVDEFLRGYRFT
jgi:methionyl-tRNA formyltransferase